MQFITTLVPMFAARLNMFRIHPQPPGLVYAMYADASGLVLFHRQQDWAMRESQQAKIHSFGGTST